MFLIGIFLVKEFQPNFKNISSPSELNFGLLSEIGVESYWFPRPVYSKLIHRPERVKTKFFCVIIFYLFYFRSFADTFTSRPELN